MAKPAQKVTTMIIGESTLTLCDAADDVHDDAADDSDDDLEEENDAG